MKKPQNQKSAASKTAAPKASDAEKDPATLEASIREELEPKIREELTPKIRKALEPEIRKELEASIRAEFAVKAKEAADSAASDAAKQKSDEDKNKVKAEDMAIRITANKDGFRRCGVAHPAAPTDYPVDKFTNHELTILENEPRLVVERL